MTRLEWNQAGSTIYENGVDRGVLYPRVGNGVPWNGLAAVEELIAGGTHTPYYYDGIKYLDFMASEDYQASIEAFSTPPEFAACDGSQRLSPGLYATQQRRERFGFTYRTLVLGEFGTILGYRLHLVYNATAAPSTRSYSSLNRTAVAPTRTWTVHSVPPLSSTYKPTAHFVIDSREIDSGLVQNLEDFLYGSPTKVPQLPPQEDVIDILSGV